MPRCRRCPFETGCSKCGLYREETLVITDEQLREAMEHATREERRLIGTSDEYMWAVITTALDELKRLREGE
jgi:hypothetical protein